MPDSTMTTITTQLGDLTTQSYTIGAAVIGIALAVAAIKIIRRLINKA